MRTIKENCVHTACQRILQVITKLVVWNSILHLKHYSDQSYHFLQRIVAEDERIHRAAAKTKNLSMMCQHTSPLTEMKPKQCLVQGRPWQLSLVPQKCDFYGFSWPQRQKAEFRCGTLVRLRQTILYRTKASSFWTITPGPILSYTKVLRIYRY